MCKYFTTITFLLFFQINALPQPYITVISPNGGEVWCSGTITWEDNIPGNVAIDLYKGGIFHSVISTSTPSDGEYAWSILGPSPSASDYKIKIISVDDSNIFDFSDSTFSFGCSINIISPNGGESWQAGSSQTIFWDSNVGRDVSIDLYKGGVLYSSISGSTPNDGTKNWDIPFTMESGSDYSVKITGVNVFDFSDSNFTIVGYEITVISPNGGEVWCSGTKQNITWEDNLSGNVEIQFFKGGVFHSSITTSTPSNGSYTWNIPSGPTGSDYLIRIGSIENGNIFDFSDSTFTIGCGINIISPNGGEIWQAGTTETIIWTADHLENVTVDLYKGGVFHSVLITTAASDTSQLWAIPFEMESGSDYGVKITSVDVPGVSDFSDSNFTIVGNNITVISPNGGELWKAGTVYSINWTSNFAENVKIELYKGGVFNLMVASSTSNDGTFNWGNMPYEQEGGTDYQIKITSINDPNIFDMSDNNFTIIENYITILTPQGGDTWIIGESYFITWDDNIAGNIEILLLVDNNLVHVIDGNDPSDGTRTWTIPSSIEPRNDYVIRIASLDLSTIKDETGEFTITNATDVKEQFSGIPDTYQLMQNYPNPFNPSTTVYYALPEAGSIELVISDVLGNEVMKFTEEQAAGYHKFEFDGNNINSGVYFYRLQAGDFVETKKMILIK